MTQKRPVATEIALNTSQRTLRVKFDNGKDYILTCEYLRVYSPSADNRVSQQRGQWMVGKEAVNIKQIEPMGAYAVRLIFDDGHRTGVYSWEKLYELGEMHDEKWSKYQNHLAALRKTGSA